MTFTPLDHYNAQGDIEAMPQLARLAREGTESELRAIEVGSWAGATTILLSDLGFHVYAVDHWCGSDRLEDVANEMGGSPAVFRLFCSNMGDRLFRSVTPLWMESRLAAAIWPASLKVDLMYIDGDHTYHGAREDILAWTPKVRHGGILAGHDFLPDTFPGVVRAVEETGKADRIGYSVWWRRVE